MFHIFSAFYLICPSLALEIRVERVQGERTRDDITKAAYLTTFFK